MSGLTYAEARAETLRAADNHLVNRLLSGYQPGDRTIILLPGGMGSQLDRSLRRYPKALPYLEYDPIWMDLGVIFGGDALDLVISEASEDVRRHVVVPNGPLRFPGLKAYDDTADYFRGRCGFNYGVFGWD